jgi:cell fate regulator YaaT (PSP1 superfamily)
MPTPMAAYREAAQRFGGVDPTDKAAVRSFFLVEFHKLGKRKQQAVMRFLMSHEGAQP